MITEIEISPEARAAGCTATVQTIHRTSGFGEFDYYILTATPGHNCSFVMWQGQAKIVDYRDGTEELIPIEEFDNPKLEGFTNFYDEDYKNSDGVLLFTRRILYIRAVFTVPPQDSAINLNLVCIPNGVGTLTGGGIKSGAVGSSVAYTVNAEETFAHQEYVFSHWIDDAGTRHNTKQFSKSFVLKNGYTTALPEQKTFTAYFRMTTGMILRSSSSELILRGKANRILRDE